MSKKSKLKQRAQELPNMHPTNSFKFIRLNSPVQGFEVLPKEVEEKVNLLRERLARFFPDQRFLRSLPNSLLFQLIYSASRVYEPRNIFYSDPELEAFGKGSGNGSSPESSLARLKERLVPAHTALVKARMHESFRDDIVGAVVSYLLSFPEAMHARIGIEDFQMAIVNQSKFHSHIPGKILIPGCGEYALADIEASRGRELILVDADPILIGILKRYIRARGFSNVTVRKVDLLHTPLESHIADGLFCKSFFHLFNLGDITKLIHNIVPAISPGGRAIIVEPISGCCEHDDPIKGTFIEHTLAPFFDFVIVERDTVQAQLSGQKVMYTRILAGGKLS